MKFIRAKFDGFRLLSRVELEFSFDPNRNITVIRAANESGKTTMLTALQWGLLGDDVLPKGYSLRRMDLEGNMPSNTRVEIEYEIEGRTGPETYRVVRRSDSSSVADARGKSRVELYKITSSGFEEMRSPNNHIQQHFPADLREVFFTDGDRALSFIEGTKSEQQDRVRNAIKTMMGLSLLEVTIDHVKSVERQLRSRFAKEAGDSETQDIEKNIQAIDKRLSALTEQIERATEKVTNLDYNHKKADRDLQEALAAGNREELSRELVKKARQRKLLELQMRKTEDRQAGLLSSELLAQHLLAEPFKKAGSLLDSLREKGQIPNKTVPILEDRLEHSECICGGSLDDSTADGRRRRKHIKRLIEESLAADNIRSKVTDIYYQARPLFDHRAKSWKEKYSDSYNERQQLSKLYNQFGEDEAELDARVRAIPDINVQRLRVMKQTYEKQLRNAIIECTELVSDEKLKKEQRVRLEKQFRNASTKDSKGKKIKREMSVAKDVRTIVENALTRLKTVEVMAVSDRMNKHFLRMIGADEQSALITKAEISEDFSIVVYGRNNLLMDPSIDLNGASRRALTVSFVLALTEVSRVKAPMVIDTPLGMMAGYVKSEVVKTASENSYQLILFLTHDEIKGCEELLDERAVVAATLTNPAHYPRILKNNPETREAVIRQCSCDHRSYCKICDRYESSAEAQLQKANT